MFPVICPACEMGIRRVELGRTVYRHPLVQEAVRESARRWHALCRGQGCICSHEENNR